MYTQWLDVINCDWMGMTKAQRKKGLSTAVRDIASYLRHDQYWSIKAEIDAFAKERGCHRTAVTMPDDCFPEGDLAW